MRRGSFRAVDLPARGLVLCGPAFLCWAVSRPFHVKGAAGAASAGKRSCAPPLDVWLQDIIADARPACINSDVLLSWPVVGQGLISGCCPVVGMVLPCLYHPLLTKPWFGLGV